MEARGVASAWYDRRSGWAKQPDDTRSDCEIDYSRVVHSASFRRLQGKTQVFNLGDSDFYRTRLTHSMEVAQIGVSLLKQIRKKYSEYMEFAPPSELIFTVGVAHDLGHPPFGHGGEVALNYCMRDHGGFEGNGQSLRIATRLEKFSVSNGYDFTRRVILALLKYPVSYSSVFNDGFPPKLKTQPPSGAFLDYEACTPPKCYLDSEKCAVNFALELLSSSDRQRFIESAEDSKASKPHKKSLHKSFDCSIMDLADDISYGVHDLEDAVAMGLIDEEIFRKHCGHNLAAIYLENLRRRYPKEFGSCCDKEAFSRFLDSLFGDGAQRKHAVSRLVHFFVSSVKVSEIDGFKEPLIRLRATLGIHERAFLDSLKEIVYDEVVFSSSVQHLEFKGQRMVVSVFEAFASAPQRFLPSSERSRYEREGKDQRVICDYVAGMTDSFLLRNYERLFSPRLGTLFDRL